MPSRVRPSVVGAFVLGALGLALIALLAFGSINFLRRSEGFVVYFDESIQGLTLGSPVKMSGVTLGRVTDAHVRYNPATNRSAVEVVCEFDRNMITDPSGHIVDVTRKGEVQELIDHGLRAQINVISFATGISVVELGFYDPKIYPATGPAVSPRHPGYPVVPAIPSSIEELQTSAMAILTNISRVDFKSLADNVQSLAVELRSLVADVKSKLDQMDLAGLSDQWKKAGAAVTGLAGDPELRKTVANLDRTLDGVRGTLASLNRQVDVNGNNLKATLQTAQTTLKQFDEAAATLQRFIAAQSGLGDSASQALNQLASAADAVQRLADFLERNPNALLTGRKPPP